MEIVAADIGGTHARFALAEVDGGRVVALGDVAVLKTADHASFQSAWRTFAGSLRRPLPPAAAIAVATPLGGEVLRFTNNDWVIRTVGLEAELEVSRCMLINDFEAVGHAVAQAQPDALAHICGPDRPLRDDEVVSVVGPGTGLGVACLVRRPGHYDVLATEGGHGDFAPLDDAEDRILAFLRAQYGRVSNERIVSGPGLANIRQALSAIDGQAVPPRDERPLWAAALDGRDSLATAALDRFCLSLGAVAGDVALVHGAGAVVLAGGLSLRLADRLPGSGFAPRFVAKGRFAARMSELPVKLVTHPQPGLFGAAAAFAKEYA